MHCKVVWPETHACTHNGTPISKHKAEYYTVQEEAVVPTVVWPETHARIVDDQSVTTLQGFRSNNQGTLVPGVV